MAENDAPSAGHPAMDYDEHEKTYRLFLQLIKYTVLGVAAVLALLAFLWG
ncbi:MAG: aa3-type cytochrome c oxidase subunit IV [Beijerinckiaceae bacterium]|nr:aa3-type cytochrome c oxidase subunit IV [Beijerinckiaceae bacterium]